jgi:predicted RNase H-like HicB family nuclease
LAQLWAKIIIVAGDKLWGKHMGNHAVTLQVTPFLRIGCKFWLTDEGWRGSCEQLSINVQAGSFEFAKSEIEIALGKYVEDLLRETQRSPEQAA